MNEEDTNKPKGKMFQYIVFVLGRAQKAASPLEGQLHQILQETLREIEDLSIKKSKFEDMAKSDKTHYDRKVKNYIPFKVVKK